MKILLRVGLAQMVAEQKEIGMKAKNMESSELLHLQAKLPRFSLTMVRWLKQMTTAQKMKVLKRPTIKSKTEKYSISSS